MRISSIKSAILLQVLAICASAQTDSRHQSISLDFVIDGQPIACADFKITLHFNGKEFKQKIESGKFTIPSVFIESAGKLSPDAQVKITFSCGAHKLIFQDIHPSFVTAGEWRIGIDHPSSWYDSERMIPEQGFWLSYLNMTCHNCDPGIVVNNVHFSLPRAYLRNLRREQAHASGRRASDIAYAMAVFRHQYLRNRDALVQLLMGCLAKGANALDDDLCSNKLWSNITNLFWRGDNHLLELLLRAAPLTETAGFNPSYFFAKVLDRRWDSLLPLLRQLPLPTQNTICKLAGNELESEPQQFQRVQQRLEADNSEVATTCLRTIQSSIAKRR